MNNMNRIIKSHNVRIMAKNAQSQSADPPKMCNCRVKANCPLEGKCLVTSVVYKATVTSEEGSHEYVGLAGGEFKTRHNNHNKSFRHGRYSNETEFSKHIWGLKAKAVSYQINWEILRKSNTHKRSSGLCNLCMDEKLEIIRAQNRINKRTELISSCRHGERPPNRSKKK